MTPAHADPPWFVQVQDLATPWDAQQEYFLEAVDLHPGSRVLDFGCRTGQLALAMSKAGHRVTGLDPAPTTLAIATTKAGADRIRWIVGHSSDIPKYQFDTVVMSRYFSQFLIASADWAGALHDIHRSLRPGGRLIFDSRNPDHRVWESWTRPLTKRDVDLSDGLVATTWTSVSKVQGVASPLVQYVDHFRLGNHVPVNRKSAIRFRRPGEILWPLERAGFIVDRIDTSWDRHGDDGEFIVHAFRADDSEL
ncbi:class I SAM-dependent methyltransferase [Plantibacter sp. YIM 135249]|uniref:class I SAM-dependent methyltransferase n=1 Tax=Plantibacter sp. YIM 135249 TaxID=3423918 RepID=UPI003D34BC4F